MRKLSQNDVCRFFLRGNCRNGSNCKFQHIESPPVEALYFSHNLPEFKWDLGPHLPNLQNEVEIQKYLVLDDDEKGIYNIFIFLLISRITFYNNFST